MGLKRIKVDRPIWSVTMAFSRKYPHVILTINGRVLYDGSNTKQSVNRMLALRERYYEMMREDLGLPAKPCALCGR